MTTVNSPPYNLYGKSFDMTTVNSTPFNLYGKTLI